MSTGFLVLMLVCGACTYSLISILLSATRWLVWAGAAYILWLAWRIANSSSASSENATKPVSFWVSFWLQFANVKIILYGITALSAFVLPYTQNVLWFTAVSILLAIIEYLGNLVWALNSCA